MSDDALRSTSFLLAPALVSALVALVATRWAARLGWVDGGRGLHKRAGENWPLSGGPALFAGALSVWVLLELWGRGAELFVPGRELAALVGRQLGREVTLWPFGALVTAFAVGCIDDGLEDGLSPAFKLFGQAASGVVLAAPLLFSNAPGVDSIGAGLLLVGGALFALNVVNTFDNSDGAALSLGILGLAVSASSFAAALAVLLPFNLRRDRASAWRRKAILGDSGSHALGMLVLITPLAWPALLLPALDLARVCRVRARLGHPPWEGDRRHLAHRLAAAGFTGPQVALRLALLAAPVALGAVLHPTWGVGAGAVATSALFALTLRRVPAPVEPLAGASCVVSAAPTGAPLR